MVETYIRRPWRVIKDDGFSVQLTSNMDKTVFRILILVQILLVGRVDGSNSKIFRRDLIDVFEGALSPNVYEISQKIY